MARGWHDSVIVEDATKLFNLLGLLLGTVNYEVSVSMESRIEDRRSVTEEIYMGDSTKTGFKLTLSLLCWRLH